MIICNLQEVYDSSNRIFNFTDPVIHYHGATKEGCCKMVEEILVRKGLRMFLIHINVIVCVIMSLKVLLVLVDSF